MSGKSICATERQRTRTAAALKTAGVAQMARIVRDPGWGCRQSSYRSGICSGFLMGRLRP